MAKKITLNDLTTSPTIHFLHCHPYYAYSIPMLKKILVGPDRNIAQILSLAVKIGAVEVSGKAGRVKFYRVS